MGTSADEGDIKNNMHKPKRFNKMANNSSKKKIPTGPLSDDYMRKL